MNTWVSTFEHPELEDLKDEIVEKISKLKARVKHQEEIPDQTKALREVF